MKIRVGGGGLGGQGGWERRIEVFVKIQKKTFFFGGGVSGWDGMGVRVGVNEELKFLRKFTIVFFLFCFFFFVFFFFWGGGDPDAVHLNYS